MTTLTPSGPLAPSAARLVIRAETAADVMTTNVLSLREHATIDEAVEFLARHGFSAAPVVDDAGRPVGVLTQTDVVLHDAGNAAQRNSNRDGDRAQVRDVMTPALLAVSPADSALRVVSEMLAYKVHRLFVVDDDGVLVGVITALDLLRKIHNDPQGDLP